MRIPLSKRRLVGGVISLALVASGAVIGVSSLSASGAVAMNRASVTCAKAGYDPRPAPTGFRRQVDPIKSYGVAVSAHPHDWTGSLSISSTFSAANWPITPGHEADPGYTPSYTNCHFYDDWAVYGFPVARLGGVDLLPTTQTNTWQAPSGTPVITPPFGMAAIAGNSSAPGPAPDPHVAFTCGNIDVTYDHPVDCSGTPGGVVTAQTTYPDCWDGLGATRPDPLKQWQFDAPYGIATSHFYYSTNGACPPGTIPCVPGKLMAQLVTQQTWIDPRPASPDFNKPLRNPNDLTTGTLALSFSSGPYYTYHSDFINTWGHDLAGIVDYCLNGNHPCPAGTYINLTNPTHQLE